LLTAKDVRESRKVHSSGSNIVDEIEEDLQRVDCMGVDISTSKKRLTRSQEMAEVEVQLSELSVAEACVEHIGPCRVTSLVCSFFLALSYMLTSRVDAIK
jgi:hypothetical protein